MKKEELDKQLEKLWKKKPAVQNPKLKEQSWEAFSAKAFVNPSRRIEKVGWQWVAAAVIMAMIAIGSLLVYQNNPIQQVNVFELVENTTLQVKRVELPDGSIVELDPFTKLEYAKNFKEHRTLKLQGTAFFQVEKDENHPFVVQCDKTTTTVLGTTFTIGQRAQENVRVRLYEGSVRMEIEHLPKNWVLEPGEEFIYNHRQVNIKPFERFIDFENANLIEIVTYIESSYHYKIVLPEVLLHQSLTLRINKKERFENIVQIIATMYDLKPVIDKEHKTVHFHQ